MVSPMAALARGQPGQAPVKARKDRRQVWNGLLRTVGEHGGPGDGGGTRRSRAGVVGDGRPGVLRRPVRRPGRAPAGEAGRAGAPVPGGPRPACATAEPGPVRHNLPIQAITFVGRGSLVAVVRKRWATIGWCRRREPVASARHRWPSSSAHRGWRCRDRRAGSPTGRAPRTVRTSRAVRSRRSGRGPACTGRALTPPKVESHHEGRGPSRTTPWTPRSSGSRTLAAAAGSRRCRRRSPRRGRHRSEHHGLRAVLGCERSEPVVTVSSASSQLMRRQPGSAEPLAFVRIIGYRSWSG